LKCATAKRTGRSVTRVGLYTLATGVSSTGTDAAEGSTVQFDALNITGNTGDAIVLTGDGTSTLNATITSKNIESTGDSLVATTNAAGTVMNLNITGNTGDGAMGGPSDNFTFNNPTGTINVTAANAAALMTANGEVMVVENGGGLSFGGPAPVTP
jgi:hypothetical protein